MSIMSIQYVDMGEYYLIYGMVTVMVVMLLVWFFIKVNISYTSEGLDSNNAIDLSSVDIENTTSEADQAIDDLLNGTNVINMFDAEHMSTDALFGKDFEFSDAKYKKNVNAKQRDYTGAPINNDEPIISPAEARKQAKEDILKKGLYGDIPVYLHDDKDQPYTKQWRTAAAGIYLPNSRTYWQATNTPSEAAFW